MREAQHREAQHRYASTQLTLPEVVSWRLRRMGLGIPKPVQLETVPHCTVLYGLDASLQDPEAIRQAVASVGPISYLLGALGCFPGVGDGGTDCIWMAASGPGLLELRNCLLRLPHTLTHATYHPHITLAYVQAGQGQRYAGQEVGPFGQVIPAYSLTFCEANGQQHDIPLSSPNPLVNRYLQELIP